jgi:hypothetical protein
MNGKNTANENAMVRFLEGGKKIVGKDVDFYDKDILPNNIRQPQKLVKLISNTLNKMKVKTGDVFLVWRIREMDAEGKLETGDWNKGWKELTVSFPGGSCNFCRQQKQKHNAFNIEAIHHVAILTSNELYEESKRFIRKYWDLP